MILGNWTSAIDFSQNRGPDSVGVQKTTMELEETIQAICCTARLRALRLTTCTVPHASIAALYQTKAIRLARRDVRVESIRQRVLPRQQRTGTATLRQRSGELAKRLEQWSRAPGGVGLCADRQRGICTTSTRSCLLVVTSQQSNFCSHQPWSLVSASGRTISLGSKISPAPARANSIAWRQPRVLGLPNHRERFEER